jgi:predicted metalloprotease
MPVDNFKLLHQSQITTTAAALYTVPANHETIIKGMKVVNNDTEALWFTLFHTVGTTYTEATTIIPEATIVAGGWAEFEGTITMDADDIIGGDAEQNSEITITIYGDEIDVS